MGKKAAQTPEPPKEEEPVEEPEPPPLQLQGDFVFPDGSEYSGQYLKKAENVCFHGEGHFISGPEVFKGSFEHGGYKKGSYESCNGSVYTGNFFNGVFHGPGDYIWPDGRVYRGMWKDGKMHGRGQYENFSFGIDKLIEGFSLNGSFLSSVRGQEEAKKTFLDEYAVEYKGSATAALRDIVAKMDAAAKAAEPVETKKGAPPGPPPTPIRVPKEYLVPLPPPQGETEEPEAAAERAAVEQIVAGPFPAPDAPAISLAKLKAFAELFPEGSSQQGQVLLYETKEDCERFEGNRLRCEQLSHVGQGVELWNPQAEGGHVRVMVLVNVASDYDVSRVRWKVAHCEEVALPEDAAPPPEEGGKKK
mmetsp:Transcript_116171/g.339772  ORF Transcript_116171/g.339772 Transcript_116171/m.339772 type:complete len:361 (+) Transcript_116171:67-1149(+)